jgi:hypothetical protein
LSTFSEALQALKPIMAPGLLGKSEFEIKGAKHADRQWQGIAMQGMPSLGSERASGCLTNREAAPTVARGFQVPCPPL